MNPAEPFEMLVREHYEPLFKFAMSLTRAESEAQDLTQQTFYVWATKGQQLRDLSKAKTWLFTTLHRAYLSARRRQNNFTHHSLDEVAEELPALAPALSSQIDSHLVLGALAMVDEVYRAAVALFYLDDFSYKEIAQTLGVPAGTVKSRIARGIVQLRRFLQAECPTWDPVTMPTRKETETAVRDADGAAFSLQIGQATAPEHCSSLGL
jgi:RNA polymerase sigma-70 factor (ECF subfamily)